MTWIKICGITNGEDAQVAVAAGANALGFVFYEKSPRRVTVETVKAIVAELPLKLEKIGVFVNETVENVQQIVTDTGLTAVQLHGEEDAEFSRALFRLMSKGLRRPIIFRSCAAHIFDKPADQSVGWDPVTSGLVEPDEAYKGKRVQKIHVAENGDLFLETHGFRPGVLTGILLDSSSSTHRGGTGQAFDWERVQPWAGVINSISRLIVAGGLNASNVQEAIHVLHPWGVDVSTGVESAPRKKDPKKIRAFVEAVRAADECN
ncbi:MAG TPA: phosphoribosylanthranilate isomerase [Terriglobales bacterium]|jgi:phosphoribosylanthranilate isomerase|nr:phosphoribosylanthranilate isomerase [Terriglobales bacterium]